MAAGAAQHLSKLQEEATCSVCMDYFKDPVSVDCGHNFCRPCIVRYWDSAGQGAEQLCPQCRSANRGIDLRPNRELGNIVETIRLSLAAVSLQEKDLCTRHQQRLQLFCEDDLTPLCVICRESREHRAHAVCPVEEAAQEHKKTLDSHSKRLLKQLEDLQKNLSKEKNSASELEVTLKTQKERIRIIFEQLKQFLEKEKQQLLKQLDNEHEEKIKKIHGNVEELEKQLSTRNDLIAEIKEKCKLDQVQLLIEVQETLRRCGKLEALKLEEDAKGEQALLHTNHHTLLQDKLGELKETFPAELEFQRQVKVFECEVTLDFDTAHSKLVLSKDGRSVSCGIREQVVRNTPDRFNNYIIVLGLQKLKSGRHYWEVEVGDKIGWSLGVCDESVSRTESFTLAPKDGLWTFWLREGEYRALSSPSVVLKPKLAPRIVGLYLDCEEGKLSVYNVTDRSLLYTFTKAKFPQTLRPYFNPEPNDGGKNEEALRILPLTQPK